MGGRNSQKEAPFDDRKAILKKICYLGTWDSRKISRFGNRKAVFKLLKLASSRAKEGRNGFPGLEEMVVLREG